MTPPINLQADSITRLAVALSWQPAPVDNLRILEDGQDRDTEDGQPREIQVSL